MTTTEVKTPPTVETVSVSIADITIENRYRKDLGDIESLAASINDLGLLNPVSITPDRKLLAGQRRIEAAKSLGWDEIDARVIYDLDELADQLQAEQDENKCRKDLTTGEARVLFAARKKLLQPEAKENSRSSRSAGKRKPIGDTRETAAKGTGRSGKTLERAEKIAEVADDENQPESVREVAQKALAEVDTDERPVNNALQEVEEAVAKAAAEAQGGEHRGQLKALTGAVRGIKRHVEALEAAFPEDTENFDPDVTPDVVRDTFRELRAFGARINKIGAQFKDMK